jgi:hypothetical protein
MLVHYEHGVDPGPDADLQQVAAEHVVHLDVGYDHGELRDVGHSELRVELGLECRAQAHVEIPWHVDVHPELRARDGGATDEHGHHGDSDNPFPFHEHLLSINTPCR